MQSCINIDNGYALIIIYGIKIQWSHNDYYCRDETRSYLKEQVDSIERPYQKFIKNVEESRQLAEEDRKGAELDREKQLQQRSHMMRYRDNNKVVRNT